MDVQELLQQATQRAAQAKPDAMPPLCPVCGHPLTRLSAGHSRTFETRFGSITVQRTRGYCKRYHKWRVPADAALGLEETAGYSPAVQEMAALLASKMPVEEARVVLKHLTGLQVPRATLDREARRQGERAQRLRSQLDQQAASEKKQLEEALAAMPPGAATDTVAKEVNYLREHQARMDYRAGQRAGEPIGSGPVEATCRQMQCRFKRLGQFWSQRSDEALMSLEMFWRNDRWHLLFPHTAFNPARN